jgi:hypothetical protein|tara:strand:- start:103 stop:360 length:258 start_codon:yes stop_codon:yes gene_type:complete
MAKAEREQDLTWYIKWASSIILMLGMTLTSQNIFPFNLYFHLLGTLGWTYVSIVWNDRALLVINSVALSIFINGILSATVKTNGI